MIKDGHRNSETSSRKTTQMMKKKFNNTIVINAQVAITKTESGMDYVQVLPDNPRVGLVEPFHGMGKAQMLSNGSFDFIRKKRVHGKPEFKVDNITLSFANNGFDYVTFVLPAEQRVDLPRLLMKQVKKVVKHLKEKGYSR